MYHVIEKYGVRVLEERHQGEGEDKGSGQHGRGQRGGG